MKWLLQTLHLAPDEAILDVGGWPSFWDESALPNPIWLLNQSFPTDVAARFPRFRFVSGDACDLPFADKEFPAIVSNSVIEHVGGPERQARFAREARRVGQKLWVQTPAKEFLMEPHYLTPFVHWLPTAWQRRLIRNFTLRGWYDRPTRSEVEALLAGIRLLRRSDFASLFPDCRILVERFFGLPKSYIAVRR